MLKNSTYKELNNMRRSADFRCEVGWRMHLRTNTPSEYQRRQYERAKRARELASKRRKIPRNNPRPQDIDSVGPLIHFMQNEGLGAGEKSRKERRLMEELKEEQDRWHTQKEDRIKVAADYIRNQPRKQFLLKSLI